jgi:hypothetical protein
MMQKANDGLVVIHFMHNGAGAKSRHEDNSGQTAHIFTRSYALLENNLTGANI